MNTLEAAAKWGVSERSAREYCAAGRVAGAVLNGKTWTIPDDAEKPARKSRAKRAPSGLLERLRMEKAAGVSGGIYHRVQIDLTYNSNHMEGSRLTHDQTRYIFETRTIDAAGGPVDVDDVVETANHFRCIDLVIDSAGRRLTEGFVKQLHGILKSGASDSLKGWFAVGDYKRLPNEVGGLATAPPEQTARQMKALIAAYEDGAPKDLKALIDFHWRFERIHPFQDGNGRVGRLILFKECLRHGVVPFIIEDDMKLYYYRGLAEWTREPGYLMDTCLAAQDRFKVTLRYFGLI